MHARYVSQRPLLGRIFSIPCSWRETLPDTIGREICNRKSDTCAKTTLSPAHHKQPLLSFGLCSKSSRENLEKCQQASGSVRYGASGPRKIRAPVKTGGEEWAPSRE